MRIYVGNLSFRTGEAQLRELFLVHGPVRSATVVVERHSGRHRGFAFVEMSDPDRGREAIEVINGLPVDGRALAVSEAHSRQAAAGLGGRPIGEHHAR